MAFAEDPLVALDALSSLLTLAVAAFFAWLWTRSETMEHLLLSVGFILVAAGYLATSTSQLDLARPSAGWDALRLAGQTAGALILLFAYLGARWPGGPRPVRTLSWTLAVLAVAFVGAYWAVRPRGALPALGDLFAIGHGIQLVAYAGCVAFSARGLARGRPSVRMLVPAAFFAWALSRYTSLILDFGHDAALVPFVLVWRFVGLVLMLLALLIPAPEAAPQEAGARGAGAEQAAGTGQGSQPPAP